MVNEKVMGYKLKQSSLEPHSDYTTLPHNVANKLKIWIFISLALPVEMCLQEDLTSWVFGLHVFYQLLEILTSNF